MQTLGIAQATYYQWRSRLRKYGDEWVNGELITRAIRFTDMSVESTHYQIVDMSLRFPNMSLKQLVLVLKVEFGIQAISSSTVHNILSMYGMGKRAQRAAELHRYFLDGLNLSAEQELLIESIDPMVRWKLGKGRLPGEVITQDVLRFHHTSPFGTAAMSIVVDTLTGLAFACFPESTQFELTTDCARIAIEELKRRGNVIKVIYIDSGSDFGKGKAQHPYTQLLIKHRIESRVIKSPTKRQNPCMQDVWHVLRRFLCEGGVAEPEKYRNCLAQLNPLIKEFLDKNYNA